MRCPNLAARESNAACTPFYPANNSKWGGARLSRGTTGFHARVYEVVHTDCWAGGVHCLFFSDKVNDSNH